MFYQPGMKDLNFASADQVRVDSLATRQGSLAILAIGY